MLAKRIGYAMVAIWIVLLIAITTFPKGCYGAEPEPQQKELTFTDKAKIVGGICLFGLFWSDPKPEETEYIYDMDNGYVESPIPTGVIKKEKKL